MPELAEVELTRRLLQRAWVGHAATEALVQDASLAKALGGASAWAEAITSRVARAAHRRGKYVWVELDPGPTCVMIHLRMTGKIVRHDQSERRFTRASWRLREGDWLLFDDARRLGSVECVEGDPRVLVPAIAQMGPEPFDLPDGPALAARLDHPRSRRLLKSALLDQRVIAGVGNIAISELFWRCHIPHDLRIEEATEGDLDALASQMPEYFDGLLDVHGDREIDYLSQGGRASLAKNPFTVYKRQGQPCPRCGASIERVVVSGRASYGCPRCQSRDRRE